MPKISAHAMVRYVERVKHMRVKDHNIKNIRTKDKERYSTEIQKMYKFSKLIYSGVFRDYNESRFRIANNTVLVLDSKESCIITLFRVDFGLPSNKENRDVRKDILNKLEQEHNKIIDIESAINERVHPELEIEHQKHMKKYHKLAEAICYSVDYRVKNRASV